MIPRTYGIYNAISEITSWKELKLVPSFLRSSLLLAWRCYILIKIEHAVALFPMMENRMVQEDVNITYGFGLTPAGKKSSYTSSYYDDDDDERPDSFCFF